MLPDAFLTFARLNVLHVVTASLMQHVKLHMSASMAVLPYSILCKKPSFPIASCSSCMLRCKPMLSWCCRHFCSHRRVRLVWGFSAR